MQLRPEITFRKIEPTDELKARIHEEIEKLDKYYDRITGCRVMVEVPHRRRNSGNLYHVRVDLTVPGGEIVASREPSEHQAYTNPLTAVDDAFAAVRRQLEDYVNRRRGRVKTHNPVPQGRVAKLFPDDGYGFIETPDRREVYFHRNSVVNGGFESLRIGAEVRFSEERGDKGPQASSVTPLAGGRGSS